MSRTKKICIIGLAIVLFIGVILFYINYLDKQNDLSDSIPGSYRTDVQNYTVYVLDEDGKYCKYEQYNIISEGKYTISTSDESIICLDKGCLIKKDDCIYEPSGNNAITYKKFSDTCTFINVQPKEDYRCAEGGTQ